MSFGRSSGRFVFISFAALFLAVWLLEAITGRFTSSFLSDENTSTTIRLGLLIWKTVKSFTFAESSTTRVLLSCGWYPRRTAFKRPSLIDKFFETLFPSIELLISIVKRGGLWSAASALSQWLEYSALLDKSITILV